MAYLEQKRKTFSKLLNSNCLNRKDDNFRKWTSENITDRSHCKILWLSGGELPIICDNCQKYIDNYKSELSQYDPNNLTEVQQLIGEVFKLRNEIKELKHLIMDHYNSD